MSEMICAVCGSEIRRDTEHYDRPRWVHVHLADTVACLAPGDIRPAQEQYIVGSDGIPYGPFIVPSGTGWPVT